MIYQPGGMFGGMYGGNINSVPGMGWGGYNQYQPPAPTPLPPSAQPRPDYGSRFGAPTFPLRNPPQYPQLPGGDPRAAFRASQPQPNPNAFDTGTWYGGKSYEQVHGGGDSVEWQPRGGGLRYDPNQAQGGGQPQMSDEYRASEPSTQPFNGAQGQPVYGRTMDAPAPQGGMFSAPGFMVNQRAAGPQQFNPWNPAPQGAALARFAEQNVMNFPRFDQSQGGQSAPGMMMNQRMAGPQPQLPGSPGPQQQSFDQFAQTLSGSGMSSGQMNDLYQKSIQPQSTNFWANTGVGTQKPPGFQTPPSWGQQTYGFDPRSMAGKTVGRDMGWYYGQDAVGRRVNQAGDAVPQFGPPADGFQRRRPWMG